MIIDIADVLQEDRAEYLKKYPLKKINDNLFVSKSDIAIIYVDRAGALHNENGYAFEKLPRAKFSPRIAAVMGDLVDIETHGILRPALYHVAGFRRVHIKQNKAHRQDDFAISTMGGWKYWMTNGINFRPDGQESRVFKHPRRGIKCYTDSNGRLHRDDGPAVIRKSNLTKEIWEHGEFKRLSKLNNRFNSGLYRGRDDNREIFQDPSGGVELVDDVYDFIHQSFVAEFVT